MKIIVTGTTGFVGTNLKEYLKKSNEIVDFKIRFEPYQTFDLLANCVVHLAGKAHDLKKVSQPQDYYEANFELTKQLFDGFLASKASVFIFMSTVKAAADRVDGVLTEEGVVNSNPNPEATGRNQISNSKVENAEPKTHYGIAKQMAEQYILNRVLPERKRVFILRPCDDSWNLENKGNLNLLYDLVAKGLPWPLGAFENQRSFLSIENLCFVIRELLENEGFLQGFIM